MSLSEALATNLKESGLIARDETLLDWLRNRDYRDVVFRNHAYE